MRKPFSVEAMVILPDHLHCIWELPPGDDDYSSRWKFIKAFFTKEVFRSSGETDRMGGVTTESTNTSRPLEPSASMQKKGEKGIWQRRFWEHTIRNERDYRIHCDYIHYNPVKHGLVKYPKEWKHSSFHEFLKKGFYPGPWGGPVEGIPGGIGEEC